MKAPLLSIVVVTWNTREITRACLASVRTWMAGFSHEVIVVDNASEDATVEMLRREFPEVRVIANDENVGFGRANNQAMRVARGDWFFLLNSDTLLIDDSIGSFVETVARETDVGIAGCTLLNEDGTTQISCARFPSLRLALLEDLLLYKLLTRRRQGVLLLGGYWTHDEPRDVDAVWGAAMLVRRRVFAETGGFDERIFMYGEDLEWCWRVKDRGWRVVFRPQGRVIHLDHRSSAIRYGDYRVDLSLEAGYEVYRGRHGSLATWSMMAVRTIGACLRLAYFTIRSIRPGRQEGYYGAQISFYRQVLRFNARRALGRRPHAH